MEARRLAGFAAGSAVVLAIVAANLWRALHAERELTAALSAQLAGLGAGQSHPMTAAPERAAVIATPARIDAVAAAPTPEGQASDPQLLQDAEYRKARREAEGYATELARAGTPLDTSQVDAIAMVLATEQKSLNQDIVALARGVDLANPQSRLDAQVALKRRREEGNRRVLDAVYPLLGAQQMHLLRAQFELQHPDPDAHSTR